MLLICIAVSNRIFSYLNLVPFMPDIWFMSGEENIGKFSGKKSQFTQFMILLSITKIAYICLLDPYSLKKLALIVRPAFTGLQIIDQVSHLWKSVETPALYHWKHPVLEIYKRRETVSFIRFLKIASREKFMKISLLSNVFCVVKI